MENKPDGHGYRLGGQTYGKAQFGDTYPRTPKRRKRNGQGSISRKANGKGYFTLTITRDYRKKVFYFHTQREAEAKRKELANQTNVNLGPEITVKDLLSQWLAENQGQPLPQAPLAAIGSTCDSQIAPAPRVYPAERASNRRRSRMMSDATEGNRKRKPLSNRTANHLRTVLEPR